MKKCAGYKEGYKVGPHPHRKRIYFIESSGRSPKYLCLGGMPASYIFLDKRQGL